MAPIPWLTDVLAAVDTSSDKVLKLLDAVKALILPFVQSADDDAATKHTGHGLAIKGGGPRTVLVEHHKPQKLAQILDLKPPANGRGRDGLLKSCQDVLQYSVNTWDQGFLDKLYASPDAVGLASELILAVLNTNVHVYQVSPALTLIEKSVAKALAHLFGLKGPHAGGISVQGGSASNTTALVVARNTLFPDTKENGNCSQGRKLVLFTNAHGHYSIEKAAQMLGLGRTSVWSVAVDAEGQMSTEDLETQINKAKEGGFTPFFVNATAGTTVLGSFDSFPAISKVCKAHHLWLHIDASWGGPAIFAPRHAHKLAGSHLADSLAINPHKMMGVPLTCSFLLGANMLQFHKANTLPAGYLFHNSNEGNDSSAIDQAGNQPHTDEATGSMPEETYDLADLTLQCGRRGDALKLWLAWTYHGTSGFATQISHAFDTAAYLAFIVADAPDMLLASSTPPPCLQVCFYYAPGGEKEPAGGGDKKEVSRVTRAIAEGLVRDGCMVDYAPG